MSSIPRREIYRRSKKLLIKLLASRWEGSRRGLERTVQRFLRGQRRDYLLRLLQRRAAALSAATLILIGSVAHGDPLVLLSDVASGNGGIMITGDNEELGFAVSGGTDINGDSLDDVVVGAPSFYANDANPGAAYVVFGKSNSTAVVAADIEAGTGGFIITGNAGFRPIGGAVSSAGLINDGARPDIVIGSNESTGGTDARMYVVHGKTTTTPVDVTSIESGTGGFVITGLLSLTGGEPIVYAFGDINGDGRDDIVIGTPRYGVDRGRVYVVFGKNGTTSVSAASIAAGTGGWVIEGAANYDEAGSTVSIAGDMNNDGRDEIVIGAPGYSGQVYVVFGKTGSAAVDLGSSFGGFSINNGYSGEYIGERVAGSGDINGDGRGDVLIGAPFNDSSSDGNVYVVFGKSSNTAVSAVDIANGVGGFVINGRNKNARAGHSLSSAGDVNSDGLEDIVIGTDYFSPAPGEAYVVFGKTSTTPVSLEDVWTGIGGFGIQGEQAYDRAGWSVSRAGDVNGDDVDDVIVGAPQLNKAYVVFGSKPAPVSVGLTSSVGGAPIPSGVVYVERNDAPIGFRAPLSGIVGGSAIYKSRFADLGSFSVTAIASGFQASDPVQASNDGSVPGIQLVPDPTHAEPNILTVIIRVVNQQGQPTGQRILTKGAQLLVNDVPLDLEPVYGRGDMVFIGAPAGQVKIAVPDTILYDFVDKIVDLGTGVQVTTILDAKQLDGVVPIPRAELPGIVIGSVLNGNVDPTDVYSFPLVVHTLDTNGLATFTTGTVDGAYVFPDVIAGPGKVQSFSTDGALAGSLKNVNVLSGQIYGDQLAEDTLLSVSPPSDDSDFDGLPDSFENQFLNTVPSNLRGPDDDPDLDGLTNFEEFVASTKPANFDSDSDGVGDGVELLLGANPNSAASTPGLQSTVYVDFGYSEPLKAGLLLQPYVTLQGAISRVTSGGTVYLKGDVAVTTGTRPAEPITKPMTIDALGGTVRIE